MSEPNDTIQAPIASSTATAADIEELRRRCRRLEEERDQAVAARALAESNFGAGLISDLAELARRAREEHHKHTTAGAGGRFDHLLHHATAFEFVARQIQLYLHKAFGGPAPPEPVMPVQAVPTEGPQAVAAPEEEAPQAAAARFDMIDVD